MALLPVIERLGEAKVLRGTAAPSSPVGITFSKGDIILNSNPSSGGPMGWMCTAGGDPGTWSAMANLS
jgi:hypothetical protein